VKRILVAVVVTVFIVLLVRFIFHVMVTFIFIVTAIFALRMERLRVICIELLVVRERRLGAVLATRRACRITWNCRRHPEYSIYHREKKRMKKCHHRIKEIKRERKEKQFVTHA